MNNILASILRDYDRLALQTPISAIIRDSGVSAWFRAHSSSTEALRAYYRPILSNLHLTRETVARLWPKRVGNG